MKLLKVAVALTLCFLSTACGKRGPLIPPDGFAPAPVSTIRVEQRGEVFRISWLMPERESGGGVASLAGFRIYRREIRSPADNCQACGPDDLLIRTVDLDYLKDVARVGALFIVTDGDVTAGKVYEYRITAFERNGTEGGDSPRVKRKLVVPPPSPAVRLSEVPAGILLEWEPVSLRTGTLAGYNIYRLRPGERHEIKPLTPVPLTEPRYEDLRVEPDTEYRYLVCAVAVVDGETVESTASPEVRGTLVLP